MTFSASPPIVSIPRESGITSSSSQSSPEALLPARTLAWIAAPSATTLSGSRLLSGTWPKSSATACCTCGPRVAQRFARRSQGLRDEGPGHVLEFLLRDGHIHRFAAGEGRGDARLQVGRQELLGGARLCEQEPRVLGGKWGKLCAFDYPAKQPLVEIVAAERSVAVGRHHLEHALGELEDRDIESAPAEIVDGVDALDGVVQAVGDRRSGRLVQ